jgi:subtilase family serine protease
MHARIPGTAMVLLACSCFISAAVDAESASTVQPSRIVGRIDAGNMVKLDGHVIKALTPDRDMGVVEDASPVRLYMNLQRTPAQQADLESLLAQQQQAGGAGYHQWLTPAQFGERFGAADTDIEQVSRWLQSRGFTVTSVAANRSVINFLATAGGVRDTFHAELHYWNIEGGRHVATANEPEIPAALSTLVAGIAGLNQIPAKVHHTPIHQERYDGNTHKWYPVNSTGAKAEQPHFSAGGGHYNMTPQDFYTIYNVNPTFAGGNVGAGATVAILGSGPFNYGTVSGGKASGGDVTTFRNLFGIKTPLKLQIQSGDANFPCSVDNGSESGESALDVEWSSALAPGATIVFESCSNATGGFLTEIQALVDANVADVISSSLGFSEPNTTLADVQAFDTAFAQAAAQGQTVLSAQGDSGSDDVDFGASQGTHGLSVDYPGSSPLVLSIGGTDFQDLYDVDAGSSIPQSQYWGSTNSQFYGDALSYVPETAWNESCASPLIAKVPDFGGSPNESTATFCNLPANQHTGNGGGGGISTFYAQPSWQKGIPGLSAAINKRVVPDVSLFSSSGEVWGHGLVLCDSEGGAPCTSAATFGAAGGTSFAAPQFAGIMGLLRTATGSRQGLVQPALYALAKAQYTAGTACYANGQTANAGITKSLPASTCIFNDVTTSGNNNECEAGTPNCFVNSGASFGVMTSSGNTSTFIDAYAAGAKFDIATGLGSVNVTNLINKWNTAFTSATSLAANPTSITAAQSTTLTATVTGGTPAGATGPKPALAGSVTFKAGTTTIGNCTLSGSSCFTSVAGSVLTAGSNSITATFAGSANYPASTSAVVKVTVTAPAKQTITFKAIANQTIGTSFAASATASSGLTVTFGSLTPLFCSVTGTTVTAIAVGSCTLEADQAGNANFQAANSAFQTFKVTSK